MDEKHSSFKFPTVTNKARYDNASVCVIVDEEVIRKLIGRFNAPMECWGFTNYPRYHAYKFHAYRNYPSKRNLGVSNL